MNIQEATEILHTRGFVLEEAKGAKTLNKAAKAADDEFYTYYKDIEKELKNYNFSGKVVYCCCDNPEWSNFYKYFEQNFDSLGLKGLISSHFESSGETYWTEYYGEERIDHPLQGNGDCTDAECKALAKKADVIVTNPPFSLFNKIVETYKNKPFVMLCTPIKMSKPTCLNLYLAGKLRYGYTTVGNFYRPEGEKDKHVYCAWYTNLPVSKNYKPLNLVEYDEEKFPNFDNEDIVSVPSQKEIPDTDKILGVPVSILMNIDPDNLPFDILGVDGKLKLNGESVFDRLLIKLR
jgi:hypothetical protein